MSGTEEIILSLVILGVLFALLGAGVWIGMTLLITGFVAVEFFTPAPSGSLLASTVWDASWPWTLTALPLFIWMGEILFRTKLSEDMFHGMSPWLNWLPGKLLHVNIIGCAIMSAITGSSAVCSATVGRMSVPELRRRGYDEFMAIGTLSGSGTLGMLIPPSIMMMVYGVVAQVSIGRLFIAGFLPGFMMMLMYQAYVVIWAKLYPEKQPRDDLALPFWEKVWASRRLIPAMVLILLVLGSIYGGVATPTEAAVIGVLGSLAFSAASGTLTIDNFKIGLINTVKTTSMIGLILAGGAFLSIALGFTGLPNVMAQWVDHLQLGKYELLIVLTILYIVLGTALDGVSMILLTAPVVFPMIDKAGIDPLWFGIYMMIVTEMSQISPPVGFCLFVVQSLTGCDLRTVSLAALPFFIMLIIGIVILTIFPAIVTWLPMQMIAFQQSG
jgi:tripartite ATP-independent transporter DctM subunit